MTAGQDSFRRWVAMTIVIVIALLHLFRVGSHLRGSLFTLYYGYASDVLVPFAMYFLLCVSDARVRALRDWRTKALLVFGLASASELLQAAGVPLLGRTFDPLDFVMFGGGVLLAAFFDRVILNRLSPRWSVTRDGGGAQ